MGGAAAGVGSGGGPAGGWTVSSHSCSATSRTDALFVDADGTFWVGCGSTQVGEGVGESVTRCRFLEEGVLVATGAASFFGVYR